MPKKPIFSENSLAPYGQLLNFYNYFNVFKMSEQEKGIKNKGGRPPGVTKNSNKIKRVVVRFTLTEYNQFLEERKLINIKNNANYLFKCWQNNNTGGDNTIQITKDLSYEVKKIGNNINQIAYQLNVRKNEYLSENMLDMLKQVALMQEKLFEKIKL